MIDIQELKERAAKGGEFPAITVYTLVAEIENMQAKIDALMLEYCPEQMTPEQLEEWDKHQVKVDINEV